VWSGRNDTAGAHTCGNVDGFALSAARRWASVSSGANNRSGAYIVDLWNAARLIVELRGQSSKVEKASTMR